MAVLYRKYRPQTFAEVVDQKHIVQTLKNQVKSGTVSHAYLFTGSRGVGKTSLARILAKAVNCLERNKKPETSNKKVLEGDACGVCSICKQVEAGNFVDLLEIDAASNTGVDNIRDLIEHVKFAPSLGSYKVFIIDEVHMLSKGAFNALLKTLEEPPAHAIFILATTEIGKVPPTIVSRTQRFDFRRLTDANVIEMLRDIAGREKVNISEDSLRLIAIHAQGGGRDALSLLDKVMSLGSEISLEDCQKLLGITDAAELQKLFDIITTGQSQLVPDFFSDLLTKGADFQIFNRDFLEFLRQGLIASVSAKAPGKVDTSQYIYAIRLFLKAYKDLAGSPSPEIPLLIAALETCQRFLGVQVSKPSAPKAVSVTQDQPLAPSPIRVEDRDISAAGEVLPISEFAFTQVLEPTIAVPASTDTIHNASFDNEVSLEEVKQIWPSVLAELKKVNGPLATLVKNSPVQSVEGGRVVLGVKYLFHKQNLENHKNFKIICDILERLIGKKVGICGTIIKIEALDVGEHSQSISDALSILGGEVVE